MTAQVLEALGGLGLFLLGMLVLTEGLRALAGDAVQRVLFRFTRSPATGALTGAAVTALLQSSSATTVATVGFVSAGLLTFSQSLGILFGANLGTTFTGWLVALLGFELKIGEFVLPLLFLGVVLRLFGRRWVRNVGWALAGFSLLFLGIATMQAGMAGLEGVLTPESFPPDTLVGRLLLVAIGVGVTLVTQSSSAGVASALTAVAAGAITFPQAAAMVVGMDVGTTSTTAIATIGGSAQTRRTGFAHVVYNLLTGAGAFLLLDPYVAAVEALFDDGVARNPTLALVGFHTTFNAIAVLVAVPLTGAFGRLMERLVPERGVPRSLDTTLLRDPNAAALELLGGVRGLARELFEAIGGALDPAGEPAVDRDVLERVDRTVDQAHRYADRILAPQERRQTQARLVASMHALDHLDRLVERCRKSERIATLRRDEDLARLSAGFAAALTVAVAALGGDDGALAEHRLADVRGAIVADRESYRVRILGEVPERPRSLAEALRRLDAMRWLDRTAYHAWRILHHVEAAGRARAGTEPPPTSRAEADPEERT